MSIGEFKLNEFLKLQVKLMSNKRRYFCECEICISEIYLQDSLNEFILKDIIRLEQ